MTQNKCSRPDNRFDDALKLLCKIEHHGDGFDEDGSYGGGFDHEGSANFLNNNAQTIREALALASALQPRPISEAPMDGREFYAIGVYQVPYRFKLYKPSSNEFKRGIKGRWQKMNEYGGWDNTDQEPSSFALSTLPKLEGE